MKRVVFLVGFVCTLLTGSLVSADPVTPETVKVKTPIYPITKSKFTPALGNYQYEVSWQGIPAATAEVSVKREGMEYHISTKAKTYSAIDIFYKLRYEASGELSSVNYMPLRSEYKIRENSREKGATVIFSPDGDIEATRFKKGRGTQEVKFKTGNATLDPFSAAFLARSLDWSLGETKVFDTYNGKSRYLIKLTAVDKKELKVNGIKRPVWVISPRVDKLGAEKNNKLRKAWIYVTADEDREILKIKSEVFVGSVKTKLINFSPFKGSKKSSLTVAANLKNGKISVN